jgi:hypothetical protein
MTELILALVIVLTIEVAFLIRQLFVRIFVSEVIQRVALAGQDDIMKGYAWVWRWRVLEEMRPVVMLFSFWRPLTIKEWFSNMEFVDPRVKVSHFTATKEVAASSDVVL